MLFRSGEEARVAMVTHHGDGRGRESGGGGSGDVESRRSAGAAGTARARLGCVPADLPREDISCLGRRQRRRDVRTHTHTDTHTHTHARTRTHHSANTGEHITTRWWPLVRLLPFEPEGAIEGGVEGGGREVERKGCKEWRGEIGRASCRERVSSPV